MRTYITIMLPLVKPAMATAAILIFMASWNDFIYNLMLSSGNNARNVSVALSQFLSMFGSDYGQLFGGIVYRSAAKYTALLSASEKNRIRTFGRCS